MNWKEIDGNLFCEVMHSLDNLSLFLLYYRVFYSSKMLIQFLSWFNYEGNWHPQFFRYATRLPPRLPRPVIRRWRNRSRWRLREQSWPRCTKKPWKKGQRLASPRWRRHSMPRAATATRYYRHRWSANCSYRPNTRCIIITSSRWKASRPSCSGINIKRRWAKVPVTSPVRRDFCGCTQQVLRKP